MNNTLEIWLTFHKVDDRLYMALRCSHASHLILLGLLDPLVSRFVRSAARGLPSDSAHDRIIGVQVVVGLYIGTGQVHIRRVSMQGAHQIKLRREKVKTGLFIFRLFHVNDLYRILNTVQIFSLIAHK